MMVVVAAAEDTVPVGEIEATRIKRNYLRLGFMSLHGTW